MNETKTVEIDIHAISMHFFVVIHSTVALKWAILFFGSFSSVFSFYAFGAFSKTQISCSVVACVFLSFRAVSYSLLAHMKVHSHYFRALTHTHALTHIAHCKTS